MESSSTTQFSVRKVLTGTVSQDASNYQNAQDASNYASEVDLDASSQTRDQSTIGKMIAIDRKPSYPFFVQTTSAADVKHEFTRSESFPPFAARRSMTEDTRRRISAVMGNELAVIIDPRFALDSRSVLKAFRLIGGFDGIQFQELLQAAKKVRDEQVRAPLLKNLQEIFTQFDADMNGVLDVLEFERMVQSSTVLQRAIYDLLERAEEDERNEYCIDDQETLRYLRGGRTINSVDAMSVGSTALYAITLAIQLDVSPDWQGWHYVELFFIVLLTIELLVRFGCKIRQKSDKTCVSKFLILFLSPTIVFDLAVLVVGWIDVSFLLSDFYPNSPDQKVVSAMRWVRALRIVRCARLIRVFLYFRELREIIEGILSGMRVAIWGLSLLVSIIFMWAIVIRTAVACDWASDSGGTLSDMFSSTPDSMLVVFRCMVLSADGSCLGENKESLFRVLSAQMGWAFNILWVSTEAFILIGILNVVASVFVVQAGENAAKIKESINKSSFHEDQLRLQQLDKLLRTLIHPGRHQSNPKDRNAAEVAMMIRTEHPEAAAKIPNLESQIVHFAKSIQEAKRLHQSAYDVYEAKEVQECKQLKSIPCAKAYVMGGEEILMTDDVASFSNTLSLPMAPMGAVEVLLVQEQETLEDLLEEAFEVQKAVKMQIYPFSTWATEVKAGSSGNIWKSSKGLCDEAIDPGPKSIERIEKKVHVKYNGRYQRNRDYARLSLIYNSVRHLIDAIPRFLQLRLSSDGMQVVNLENRFLNPHPLGWRDVTMLIKVRLPTISTDHDFGKISTTSYRASSSTTRTEIDESGYEYHSHHIMEVQMRLKGLAEVCHEGHKFYEEIRASLPDNLVTTILDRLVTDTTLDLGITKSEWLQCLPNKEVKALLDALGIPRRGRKQLFDIIDIDGSGTVTTSELQEMLMMFKAPVHAHELAGCHYRVRDIQQKVQTKVEPQLAMLQTCILRHIETNEDGMSDLFLKLAESFNSILSAIQYGGDDSHTLGKSHNRSSMVGRYSLVHDDDSERATTSFPLIRSSVESRRSFLSKRRSRSDSPGLQIPLWRRQSRMSLSKLDTSSAVAQYHKLQRYSRVCIGSEADSEEVPHRFSL